MTSLTIFFGMDLFFILSGFLIGSILLRSLETSGIINVRRFYLRRVFRTFPAYYVVLTALVLLVGDERHAAPPPAARVPLPHELRARAPRRPRHVLGLVARARGAVLPLGAAPLLRALAPARATARASRCSAPSGRARSSYGSSSTSATPSGRRRTSTTPSTSARTRASTRSSAASSSPSCSSAGRRPSRAGSRRRPTRAALALPSLACLWLLLYPWMFGEKELSSCTSSRGARSRASCTSAGCCSCSTARAGGSSARSRRRSGAASRRSATASTSCTSRCATTSSCRSRARSSRTCTGPWGRCGRCRSPRSSSSRWRRGYVLHVVVEKPSLFVRDRVAR